MAVYKVVYTYGTVGAYNQQYTYIVYVKGRVGYIDNHVNDHEVI